MLRGSERPSSAVRAAAVRTITPEALVRAVSLLLVGSLLLAGPVIAGDYPYSVNFHFSFPSYSGCNEATVADAALTCGVIDTDANDYGPGQPNFVWLLVGGVPAGSGPGAPGGIGGIQFGLYHSDDGISISSWTLCTGGSEIPQDDLTGTWPEDGTGNAITWAGGCRLVTDNADGLTRIGYFTLFPGPGGVFSIDDDPRTGSAEAAECDASPRRLCTWLLGRGDTTIGGGEGENTCDYYCLVDPVAEMTWSGLKAMYPMPSGGSR